MQPGIWYARETEENPIPEDRPDSVAMFEEQRLLSLVELLALNEDDQSA